MKKLLLICLLLCILIANLYAEDVNFGWSLGTIWIYHDVNQNKSNADVDILHFNWLLYNRVILAFNVLSVQGSNENDEINYLTLLPLEAAFVPFLYRIGNSHELGLSLYGKIGWEIISYEDKEYLDSGGFSASVGSQLFLQLRETGSKSPYSRFLSIFVDYNFAKKLKFGISVDLSPFIFGLIIFNNDKNASIEY
jgi:hypothetical protein